MWFHQIGQPEEHFRKIQLKEQLLNCSVTSFQVHLRQQSLCCYGVTHVGRAPFKVKGRLIKNNLCSALLFDRFVFFFFFLTTDNTVEEFLALWPSLHYKCSGLNTWESTYQTVTVEYMTVNSQHVASQIATTTLHSKFTLTQNLIAICSECGTQS